MGASVKKTVESLAAPIAQEMGYELADTDYSRQGKDWLLTLFIDKPGGVDIDDCERFSRAVEAVLDERDPIDGAYTLVVSSPGLDRPLKKAEDFERFRGETVDVKLYKPFMGSKEFTGILSGHTDDSITIESGDKEITFELPETARISLHVDF